MGRSEVYNYIFNMHSISNIISCFVANIYYCSIRGSVQLVCFVHAHRFDIAGELIKMASVAVGLWKVLHNYI